MNHPNISIIIPVYNVEPYLRQCLDSVSNQSLKGIEIICINDGSTDNSLNILKEYASKDKRIRILDVKNGGQGLARNRAIKEASGEYLGFVDSDDWIDPTMFHDLYECAKKFDADVTICEIAHYNSHNGIISQPEWLKLPIDNKFDDKFFKWEDILEVGFQINSGPVNKIYRNHFIRQRNIEFSTGLYYEDILFVYKSLINAKRICLVRKPLYLYRYSRPGSISSDTGKKQFDIFVVLNQLQKSIEKIEKYEQIKIFFYKYKFDQYLSHFRKVNKEYKKEFRDRMKTEFNNSEKEIQEHLFACNVRLKMGIKYGFFFYLGYEYLENIQLWLNRKLFGHSFKR